MLELHHQKLKQKTTASFCLGLTRRLKGHAWAVIATMFFATGTKWAATASVLDAIGNVGAVVCALWAVAVSMWSITVDMGAFLRRCTS